MDLESEFQKLMEEVIERIEEKRDNGEYAKYDAAELISMVKERMPPPENVLCPTHGGHKDDCGWSSSMGYHCD